MEPDIGTHRNLIAWQKAMHLARDVYAATGAFPRHEMFGLTSQLRRSAVSIPSNVAEGAARSTTKEFIAFLHIARGSQAELETHLRLASDLGYLDPGEGGQLLLKTDEVGRLLTGMIMALRRRLGTNSSSLSAIR